MRGATHVRELDAPGDVLVRLASSRPQRYPALFDSAADGPLGRTSVLAAFPRAALWSDRDGQVRGTGVTAGGASFLEALESWYLAERAGDAAGALFEPGWVLFLSYECAAEIEPRLVLPGNTLPWRAFALRTPAALVYQHATRRLFAVAEQGAEAELERMIEDAQGELPDVPQAGAAYRVREEDPERFLERVRRAQDYVRAGDIYQANLSRPWRAAPLAQPGGSSAGTLYGLLRERNPAPFAALVQWDGVAILSSSPERLVRCEGRRVETRPIAGTRPRGATAAGDALRMAELIEHPKERAEHIMLIDLERNDLGRICEAGSVRVDEMMRVETYAHVHHIVSNVTGRLRPEVTPIGVVRAVFPGGTITGCPKFRCMQIIAELEGEGRGAYTGSLGYLSRDGAMDLNILIRTMTLRDGRVELRAGAGIVADSDPAHELEETRAKAAGLLAVFGAAADDR